MADSSSAVAVMSVALKLGDHLSISEMHNLSHVIITERQS